MLYCQVLSGQYLHVDEDSQLPIRVDVETVGVPEDCAILSTEVRIEITILIHFNTSRRGDVAEWFKVLDLKSGSPWFKSSTLPLAGFVLGNL